MRARNAVAAVVSLCVMAPWTAAGAEDAALRTEIEKSLREQVLQVWFPRVLDRENGGFLCDWDYQWQPARNGGNPKTIVFQARCTWLASQGAMRYKDDPRYREAADHGARFLRDVMWDADRGGFYWHLDRAGKVDPRRQGVKHAYGISFGIYGLAAHYKATHDAKSLELAQKAFQWLEQHGHDAQFRGYHEFYTRDGSVIRDAGSNPIEPRNSGILGQVGYKTMNTHIHLLEAFTALYEVWPDAKLKERTIELLELVRDRITAPPGAMHLYFNADWTPVPDHDSFGHDIETAYLLIEASEAVGQKDNPKTMSVAKSLLDHGLDYGWDKQTGGFFETGGTFGPVIDKSKGWWTQAEGMNALLIMSRKYPDDPRRYRELFEKQWAYVKANVIDAEHGEWYPTGLDAGGNAKANKASEWKAGYHGGRALLNAVEWLEGKE